MRMKKSPAMVVLGFLILSLTVVHAQAGQGGAMTSATLQNPVAVDGRWTNSKEWTDALRIDCGWGWVALKDDSNSLYVLVDFVNDKSPENGDWAFVSWDQKNDGGTKPQNDDYRLVVEYTSTTTFQSLILEGTGVDWGNQKAASSVGISANSTNDGTNDPYSSSPHVIYEFQVPRVLLDNSTTIKTIGFVAGAHAFGIGFIMTQKTASYLQPSTWNTLTFSIPVPEFSPAVVMVISLGVTAALVLGRRKESLV
jgi:hypothetical protein